MTDIAGQQEGGRGVEGFVSVGFTFSGVISGSPNPIPLSLATLAESSEEETARPRKLLHSLG